MITKSSSNKIKMSIIVPVYNVENYIDKCLKSLVNQTIKDFEIIGGCSGNLQGIKKLILNRDINEIIDLLQGIKCGFKETSCPDQIAQSLREYKTKRSN